MPLSKPATTSRMVQMQCRVRKPKQCLFLVTPSESREFFPLPGLPVLRIGCRRVAEAGGAVGDGDQTGRTARRSEKGGRLRGTWNGGLFVSPGGEAQGIRRRTLAEATGQKNCRLEAQTEPGATGPLRLNYLLPVAAPVARLTHAWPGQAWLPQGPLPGLLLCCGPAASVGGAGAPWRLPCLCHPAASSVSVPFVQCEIAPSPPARRGQTGTPATVRSRLAAQKTAKPPSTERGPNRDLPLMRHPQRRKWSITAELAPVS